MKASKRHKLQVSAIVNALDEVIQVFNECPDVPEDEFVGILEMFVTALKMDMFEQMCTTYQMQLACEED